MILVNPEKLGPREAGLLRALTVPMCMQPPKSGQVTTVLPDTLGDSVLHTLGLGLPGRAPGASGTRPRPLLVIKLLPALGPADCHSQETLWSVQLLPRVG